MSWLARIGKVLVVLFAAVGVYQLWPKPAEVVNVYYPSDFSTAPDGVVGFQSWNPKSGKDVMDGGANSVQQTSGGLLVLPPQASKDNPVPAVVILHGSGGDWTGRSVYLANRLAKHGIAGFAVDTFVARDLRSSDPYLERVKKASVYTQMVDGLKALEALQQHPMIQGDKVAVTGFSLGAAASLYSMFEPVAEGVLGKEGPRFSAYASFYAGCSFDFEDFRVEGSPVLIMMGEADESMSIPKCEAFREKLEAHGVDTDLKVYAGAGHGWEQPYPQAFVEGAVVTKDCQMLWTKEGDNIEQTTGQNVDTVWGAIRAFSQCSHDDGYTNGLNVAAKEQSWQDFYQFLQDSWGIAPQTANQSF
ncbi:dienelactone hydrolase family protein [Paraferrimonas sedimenticola]|uniref:Dienelactone hydrolase domain-containing protein n=1 Tax=Paraferrimonas sedimenticola TaxID=375674 RepID=A0AA37RUI9_9GAMM|nr:dienelactone hydrolase family protein [Paraferrimonas sedimenticola]GLP95114.1 hypothetical protein GCM10007895_04200 [Paraferrimonas sedimenticola]